MVLSVWCDGSCEAVSLGQWVWSSEGLGGCGPPRASVDVVVCVVELWGYERGLVGKQSCPMVCMLRMEHSLSRHVLRYLSIL